MSPSVETQVFGVHRTDQLTLFYNARRFIVHFNLQRKINKDLGKAVGHIALSWSVNDKDKLTPDIMVERAQEYMKLMDIKNTQYVIVQHLQTYSA